MKKKVVLIILIGVMFVPLGVGLAYSTSATGYQIPWDAYSSGGEQMDSTNYHLTGTAGQSIVGGTSGDGQKIGAGFWTVFTETLFMIFLPLILR